MNWPEQIRIRNQILRGEQAAATRVEPSPWPVVDWFALQEQQAVAAEIARMERDRVATERHEAAKRAQSQRMQDAQRAWAEVRSALRSAVIEAQQAVAACEARVNGSDFDDAVRAAAELVVYQRRLENAQTSFAQHAQRSPL